MRIWSTYMHSLKWFKHTPIGRNYCFGVPRQKPGKFSRVDIQHKDSLRGNFLGQNLVMMKDGFARGLES